jgi:adenylate cyclase
MYIGTTFFRSRQTETERQYVHDAFGRFMAPALVDEIAADPAKLKLGGETRVVTLMFSDLRGFTSLSERLTPEQLVGLLNRYLGKMVEVIDSYGGTIDEFIGDAIFVLFGAPFSEQDDAERAVACAVAMQLAMTAVNDENHKLDLPELEMGIGIHTGQVVVGNIGSTERMKYGVVGSHVNLASRIQSYTTGGEILVSESTARAAGPILKLRKKIEVQAKGIQHPVAALEVLGIAGRHNLFLYESEGVVTELSEPIPFRYAMVEDTRLGKDRMGGSLLKLGPKQAEVRLETAIAVWANLEMRFSGPDGREIPGGAYAKAVAKNGDVYGLRFTSIDPEIAALFHQLIEPEA